MTIKPDTMDLALAVKRGEKRIADLPEGRRGEIRDFLRKTPERELRAASLERQHAQRSTFRRGPRPAISPRGF